MTDPFIGEISIIPFDYSPHGWAFCTGSLMPIKNNESLYSIIWNRYGGHSNENTFGLPNLSGRVPINDGKGQGVSKYIVGQSGGSDAVTLQVSQMPAHRHALHAQGGIPSDSAPSGSTIVGVYLNSTKGQTTVYSELDTVPPYELSEAALSQSGNGNPHENRQPFLALPFCIALTGQYPRRSG